MTIFEDYINEIIDRQKKLEKITFKVLIGHAILVFLILFALVIASKGDVEKLLIAGVLAYMLSSIALGFYLVYHIHSCMNGCNLMKVHLRNGGIKAAEQAMNNTSCTKNIDTDKLKKLITRTIDE